MELSIAVAVGATGLALLAIADPFGRFLLRPRFSLSFLRRSSRGPEQAQQPTATRAMPQDRKVITGKARVIDGQTLMIGRIRLLLVGVKAPDLEAPFGPAARLELIDICRNHTIRAELTGEIASHGFMAQCALPWGSDVGAELVKRGYALDLPRYSGGRYRHMEPPHVRQKLAGLVEEDTNDAVRTG